jgi:hypothetical protein
MVRWTGGAAGSTMDRAGGAGNRMAARHRRKVRWALRGSRAHLRRPEREMRRC